MDGWISSVPQVVLLEQDMLPSDGVIDTANTEIQIEALRGYCFTAVVMGL